MPRTLVNREQAQSFDRVARDYDRLGELSPGGAVGPWLERGLPAAGRRALDLGCGTGRHAVLLARRFEQVDAVDVSGPMIEVARARRPRPNISYRQADLHDLSDTGRYDLIVSTMTLHHVPDLHAALRLIRGLLAPGGRMLIADMYDLEPGGGWSPLALARAIVPLRTRLRLLATQRFADNLLRRGPAIAREIHRLQTRREWLDHRVSDRFFSRRELVRCCDDLLPGCQLEILGGPRGIALTWDAPPAV